MNVLAFDIETTYGVGDESKPNIVGLGDGDHCAVFHSGAGNRLAKSDGQDAVNRIYEMWKSGYTICGHNSLSFDFKKLYELTGDERVKELALNHVDTLFAFLCTNGHFVSLDKICQSIGIAKLDEFKISTGNVVAMSSELVPSLWDRGEEFAVVSHLRNDIVMQHRLATHIISSGSVRWLTGSYTVMERPLPFVTVEEALRLPLPDTSWMKNPPSRWELVEWLK